MNSDTPETDSIFNNLYYVHGATNAEYEQLEELARRKERDLNECKAALVKLDQIYRGDLCNKPERPEWLVKWIPLENAESSHDGKDAD